VWSCFLCFHSHTSAARPDHTALCRPCMIQTLLQLCIFMRNPFRQFQFHFWPFWAGNQLAKNNQWQLALSNDWLCLESSLCVSFPKPGMLFSYDAIVAFPFWLMNRYLLCSSSSLVVQPLVRTITISSFMSFSWLWGQNSIWGVHIVGEMWAPMRHIAAVLAFFRIAISTIPRELCSITRAESYTITTFYTRFIWHSPTLVLLRGIAGPSSLL
jgi:hypothetical protein